jgi:hypothetical protein
MRAIIKQYLVRPSWSGRKVIEKKVVAREFEIEDKVNEYIRWRLDRHNYIPVEKFDVTILKQRSDKVVGKWSYRPTYRKD